MELSGHEEGAEIPMPINSAFVGVHGYHHGLTNHRHHHDPSSSSSHNHHNIIPSNNSNGTSTITTTTTILEEDDHPHHHHHLECDINDDNCNSGDNHDGHDMGSMKKKMMMIIKYRECMKNHAASMGGNATDGCGEFMPSGEEGSVEFLTCSVCNCHRNFHRKEIEGQQQQNMVIIPPPSTHSQFYPSTPHSHLLSTRGRKVILGSGVGYPTAGSSAGQLVPFPRSVTINMPYTLSDHHSDDHHHHGNGGRMMMVSPHHHDHHNQVLKKRFRTKFSQEQKEKMMEFAEKVGWKIQKQEEEVVQQFCQEIGVKRRVLKVWMHNNKHNLGKKSDIIDNNIINNSS